MEKIIIQDFLESIKVDTSNIFLDRFDLLGSKTAIKKRKPDNPLYKINKYARTNYERGILVYYLLKQFSCQSYLEIGTGRGYSALCAAMYFYDNNINSKVNTIDIHDSEEIKKNFVDLPDWGKNNINFITGASDKILENINDIFDLVFIDGGHSEKCVQRDWNWAKKHAKYVLFDDYCPRHKKMQVWKVVDKINMSKKLIISDRRFFKDDRNIKTENMDYGQVLVKII